MKGSFVTFEGCEGTGKSSLISSVAASARAQGMTVTTSREPGGSSLAERGRELLLGGLLASGGAEAEAVLFALCRSDHVSKTISPALAAGHLVLCDRFFDSTRAYQGASGGVGTDLLASLEREAVGSVRPDLTIILDCDVSISLGRAAARRGAAAADRFEREGIGFHRAVREGFLEIARREPDRCRIVDASLPAAEVATRVWAILEAFFGEANKNVANSI